MATLFDQLEIKTETSGFASPAETYVDKRLDINELIINDVYSTFYFRYKGPKHFNIQQDDVVVVDRSVTPVEGDLVIWPAWMPHEVETNTSNTQRVNIAFNIKL